MVITATDLPDLSETTTLSRAFRNIDALVTVPGMNEWDVSTVTILSLYRNPRCDLHT